MAQEKPETIVYVSNCGDPSISVLSFDRAKGDVELIEKTTFRAPRSRRRPACRWR